MRYKPERALTHIVENYSNLFEFSVEMRYKPERALTLEKLVECAFKHVFL